MSFDKLRDRLHARLGIVEIMTPEPVGNLKASEWNDEFERLQRNRLMMGAIRYGRIGALDKKKWDRIPDMIKRLEAYRDEGNLEYLVDVANLCLLEYVEGDHPLKHFQSKDDGTHTKVKT
jgi:hypothetical protein